MWQLLALILSLCVEVPIVTGIVARSDAERDIRPVLAFAAAATLISHPLAWMGSLELVGVLPYAGVFVLVELCVVVAEAAFFRFVAGWSVRTSIIAALVANVASAAVGLVLWELVPRSYLGTEVLI